MATFAEQMVEKLQAILLANAGLASAGVITVEPSRCRRCGSTRRGEYYGKTEQAFQGIQNGLPFTHIVRRRTKCLDCGQVRIDRAYENRPGE